MVLGTFSNCMCPCYRFGEIFNTAYNNQYNTGVGSLRKIVLNKQVVMSRLSQIFYVLTVLCWVASFILVILARRTHGGFEVIGYGVIIGIVMLLGMVFWAVHKVLKDRQES